MHHPLPTAVEPPVVPIDGADHIDCFIGQFNSLRHCPKEKFISQMGTLMIKADPPCGRSLFYIYRHANRIIRIHQVAGMRVKIELSEQSAAQAHLPSVSGLCIYRPVQAEKLPIPDRACIDRVIMKSIAAVTYEESRLFLVGNERSEQVSDRKKGFPGLGLRDIGGIR